MSASLNGKSVIVTGGSKGIGKGIARVFAGHGAKVLVVARHPQDAEAAAEELSRGGATVGAFAADVTKLADMEAMARAAVERHGGLDVLCVHGSGLHHRPDHHCRWVQVLPESPEALASA